MSEAQRASKVLRWLVLAVVATCASAVTQEAPPSRHAGADDDAVRRLQSEVKTLLGRLRSARPTDVAAAKKRLEELRHSDPELFRAALLARRDELVRAWEKVPERKVIQEIRDRVIRLGTARSEALSFIEDETRYPHASSTSEHGDAAQAEVDRRVTALVDLWGDKPEPPKPVARASKGVLATIAELRDVRQFLATPGAAPDEVDRRLAEVWLLPRDPAEVNLRNFALDEAQRRVIDESDAILAANDALVPDAAGMAGPTADELLQAATTNAYRVMLGRRALRFDSRLWKAAQRHGEWMTRTGQFEHFEEPDSETRTSGQRALKEGYPGKVTENIAYGVGIGRMNGIDAHWEWYGSPGHHRAMVDAKWTDIGSASDGIFWVAVYGVDSQSRGGP